jgi:hypothetical protein
MTPEEIAKMLKDHKDWLAYRSGKKFCAKTAVLRDADLRGAL